MDALHAGDLVTMHTPGGRTHEGRYWTHPLNPHAFVIDMRRSSLADNGFRRVDAGAVVHHLRVRCSCEVGS